MSKYDDIRSHFAYLGVTDAQDLPDEQIDAMVAAFMRGFNDAAPGVERAMQLFAGTLRNVRLP